MPNVFHTPQRYATIAIVILISFPDTIDYKKQCYRKDDRAMLVNREPLRRYGHSKLSKMAAAAILNLFESKIAPLIRRPRKPRPITKHEVDRMTGCGDMAI